MTRRKNVARYFSIPRFPFLFPYLGFSLPTLRSVNVILRRFSTKSHCQRVTRSQGSGSNGSNEQRKQNENLGWVIADWKLGRKRQPTCECFGTGYYRVNNTTRFTSARRFVYTSPTHRETTALTLNS